MQTEPMQAQSGAMDAQTGTTGETPYGDSAQARQTHAPAQSEVDNAYAAAARRRTQAQYEQKLQRERTRMGEVAQKLGFCDFDTLERHALGQNAQGPQADDAGAPDGAQAAQAVQAGAQAGDLDQPPFPVDAQQPGTDAPPVPNPMAQQALDMEQAQIVEQSMQAFTRQFPDSGIRTVQDFLKLPQDELLSFYNYVSRGLDYSEAYLLTHHRQIAQQQAEAARQAAYNTILSKAHLQQLGGDDAQAAYVHVPADTLQTYRQWFPTWTDARIRAHYARSTRGETTDV